MPLDYRHDGAAARWRNNYSFRAKRATSPPPRPMRSATSAPRAWGAALSSARARRGLAGLLLLAPRAPRFSTTLSSCSKRRDAARRDAAQFALGRRAAVASLDSSCSCSTSSSSPPSRPRPCPPSSLLRGARPERRAGGVAWKRQACVERQEQPDLLEVLRQEKQVAVDLVDVLRREHRVVIVVIVAVAVVVIDEMRPRRGGKGDGKRGRSVYSDVTE